MGFEEDVKAAVEDAVKQAGNPNALALKCGLNQGTLSRWLSGERDPKLSGIAKIMDYLDMTVAKRGDAAPFPPIPKPGDKSAGVATSIMESKRLALENAKLEGQVELLKELLGASRQKEKSAG